MKLKKIFLPIICAVMLCGCSMNSTDTQITEKAKENTRSNISQTTTSKFNTTTPTAQAMNSISDLSKEKVVWGPGNITDHKQPADPLSLEQTFSSLGGRWLLKNEKEVCLTFDEGYENGFTPQILDTLKEKEVSAVFFVTYDFASANPELIERMIKEGHIVGNHTYRHYTMDEVDEKTAREEVTYLHKYIKDNFNYTMSYFRFPKGEFSQQALAIVNDLGYKSIFWSYAYADWDPEQQPDESKAFTSICESTHPGEIILLHAVSKTNADILGNVIDDIRKQGYTFTVKI